MVKITPQPIVNKFGRATQQEIADTVGVTRQTVAKFLNEERMTTVNLEVLAKLALACDVEPGAFFIMVAPNGDTAP